MSPPVHFRLSKGSVEAGEDTVGHELEIEKEGGNRGGRGAGADTATDSQRPLGLEAFFTDEETEAKGQRYDQDYTVSPSSGQD